MARAVGLNATLRGGALRWPQRNDPFSQMGRVRRVVFYAVQREAGGARDGDEPAAFFRRYALIHNTRTAQAPRFEPATIPLPPTNELTASAGQAIASLSGAELLRQELVTNHCGWRSRNEPGLELSSGSA